MSVQSSLEASEGASGAREREMKDEWLSPASDTLMSTVLEDNKPVGSDEIANPPQAAGERVSSAKSAVAEKRKEAVRTAKRKSSSWYAGATRSIAIVKTESL